MIERKDVIIDTDLGADCDDCIALALAFSFHHEGLINLDTISLSTRREYAPQTLKALLDYYHHSASISQMAEPSLDVDEKDNYCYLFKDYPLKREVDESVKSMRKKLANSSHPLVIAAIGPLTNIARLIDSEGDEISPLSGRELIKEKVECFYIMCGRFLEKYAEWNIKSDIESAIKVFEEIETPIYVISYDCGKNIKTGGSLFNEKNNPVYKSIENFALLNENSPLERESWDPITILSIIGHKSLRMDKKGKISIDKNGISTFKEGEGNHFIVEIDNEEEIKEFINEKIKTKKKEKVVMANNNVLSKKELEIQKRSEAKIKSILFPSDIDKNDKENNYITLKNINKIYDNDVQAVFDFNLNIKKNEFIVLVGPSGCGKSTTLRMIAGLEDITSGELFINSVYSNELAPKNRDIAMVFQTYALYPHMTVYKNLAFGLRIRKFPTLVKDKEGNDVLWIDKNKIKKINSQLKDCEYIIKMCDKEIAKLSQNHEDEDTQYVAEKKINFLQEQIKLANSKKESLLKDKEETENNPVPKYALKHLPREEVDKRVKEAARILEIENYLSRKPRALSGGQRQRVALGRAIVRNSAAFLMDEPLSNLDAKLRVQMRSEIVNIHKAVGATTIYVTHDQTEAMTMADRIVVMRDGMVQQIGTPIDIYSHPKNLFVAQFIGAPAMNVFEGRYNHESIIFDNNLKQIMKGKEGQIKSYYEEEIQRLNAVVENMNELLRDKKHPRYRTFESTKNEALSLISNYQEKLEKLDFDVLFGIRPEDVVVSLEKNKDAFVVKADMVELLGSEYFIHVTFAGHKIIVKTGNDAPLKAGDTLYISFKEDKIHLFDISSEMAII